MGMSLGSPGQTARDAPAGPCKYKFWPAPRTCPRIQDSKWFIWFIHWQRAKSSIYWPGGTPPGLSTNCPALFLVVHSWHWTDSAPRVQGKGFYKCLQFYYGSFALFPSRTASATNHNTWSKLWGTGLMGPYTWADCSSWNCPWTPWTRRPAWNWIQYYLHWDWACWSSPATEKPVCCSLAVRPCTLWFAMKAYLSPYLSIAEVSILRTTMGFYPLLDGVSKRLRAQNRNYQMTRVIAPWTLIWFDSYYKQ